MSWFQIDGGSVMRVIDYSVFPRRLRVFSLALALLALPAVCISQSSKVPAEAVPPGPNMILIPGGEFMMGVEGVGSASPAHTVRIDPFYMDVYEVTNAEYQEFCEETGRHLPAFWGIDTLRSGPDFPNHPVMGVSWSDARAFAKWRGARLPTEAEWEYAARAGTTDRDYTHGNEFDSELYANRDAGGPLPVGSFSQNDFGLYDMTSNACEWVRDWFDEDYYSVSPADNPTGPGAGWFKSIRGGGWHTGPGCSKVYDRNGLKYNFVDFNIGFRCAKYVGESGALNMETIIEEAGIDAALTKYHVMKESDPGKFYFDEIELNEVGYGLLQKEKVDEAIEIFKIAVESFPQSPNAFDSLGEGYMTRGDKVQAIESYEKSLELNPRNQGALDALVKLREK